MTPDKPKSAGSPRLLLKIEELSVAFPILKGIFLRQIGEIRAVEKLNLEIYSGEVFGLIGESGSGKTTVGKVILRILQFSAYGVEIHGKIWFYEKNGQAVDLLQLPTKELAAYRWKIQMIFQDPFSSLNPRMRVRDIISEPLRIMARNQNLRQQCNQEQRPKSSSTRLTDNQREQRVDYLLERVGLSKTQSLCYPHEFSGGQRQRIGIARSLATNPELIIADEAVSALDVSIQAQIINLINELKEEFGFAFLFIAHDLAVVHHISQRIGVMYLGNLVETGTTAQIFARQSHPYTRSLIAATPTPDPEQPRRSASLQGEIASAAYLKGQKPQGCPFASRCPLRLASLASLAENETENEANDSAHRLSELELQQCTEETPLLRPWKNLAPSSSSSPLRGPEQEFLVENEVAGDGSGDKYWVACHFPYRGGVNV